MDSASRPVALVTGANKGIGFEIARQLARGGYSVVLCARDAGRLDEAVRQLLSENLAVHGVLLNVTDESSIQQAVNEVRGKFGRLDVLVNNAGIALDDSPPSRVSMEVVRRTFDTNVFGVIAVTQAFLPLLRRSDAARIVNMSSALGSLEQTSDTANPYASFHLLAYNTSKTALNQITVQFANELRSENIKVNAADPGYVATDLNGHSGTSSPQEGAAVPVQLATLDANGPTGGFFNVSGPAPW